MKDVPGKGKRQDQYERRYYARRHWLDSIKIAAGCKDCGISGPPEVPLDKLLNRARMLKQ